jgi:hypothetical protein
MAASSWSVVVLMLMMTVMIWLYRRITGSSEMEGMI